MSESEVEMVDCAKHGEQVKWGTECRICFSDDIARWGCEQGSFPA